MNWTINQTVDLQRGYENPIVWPDALLATGDSQAHTWQILVRDGGEYPSIAGAKVTGLFQRSDGVTVAVGGTVAGNVIRVILSEPCYAVAGKMTGTVRMMLDDKMITLAIVIFHVREVMLDAMVDPGIIYQNYKIDASPAGVYATLAALNAAKPDPGKIYLTLDDGKWNYYNGTIFVAGGIYQNNIPFQFVIDPSDKGLNIIYSY